MILHIHLLNSLTQCTEQSTMDLYPMCVVSFNVVNIQMQIYFDDQKYQFLKSQPFTKDFEKKDHNERCENVNKKCVHKRDIAKKTKVEQQERYTEKRKNDHEICHTSKREKYNLAQTCESSQIEKSQDKSTYDSTQMDSKKCLCK